MPEPETPTDRAITMMVDGHRMVRLRRHLLRLARAQPGLTTPHHHELWVACAAAAALGFMASALPCEDPIPEEGCRNCQALHAAQQVGYAVGCEVHADLRDASRARQTGRMN